MQRKALDFTGAVLAAGLAFPLVAAAGQGPFERSLGEVLSHPKVSPPSRRQLVEELCSAADFGDMEAVRKALAEGADPNGHNTDNLTPLFIASREGRTDVVSVLLDSGADARARVEEGWTALMAAAIFGHPDVARMLIDHGADVDARDHQGRTALYIAVAAEQEEVARILIAAGADVNTADRDGTTPLIHAVIRKQLEQVELLVRVPDIDLEARDGSRLRAIDHARNFSDAETASILTRPRGAGPSSPKRDVCFLRDVEGKDCVYGCRPSGRIYKTPAEESFPGSGEYSCSQIVVPL